MLKRQLKLLLKLKLLFALLGKPLFLLLLNIVKIIETIGQMVIALGAILPQKFVCWLPNQILPKFSLLTKKLIESLSYFRRKHFQWPKKLTLKPVLKLRFPWPKINFLFLFSFFLVITFLVIGFFFFQIIKNLPNPEDLANHRPFLTTKIYDRQGRLLYKIYRQENRSLITQDQLSPELLQATLAAEDKEFWYHPGISLKGIIRALIFNFSHPGKEPIGGSTITQQLVKNVFFESEKTFQRKLKEIFLSLLVEKRFSKQQILQMYFNQISYGGTAYGVEEAAQKYFGKHAWELNLAEAALLAGLPKAPSRYSPYGPYPELAKKRQKEVLSEMVKAGYITQEQYQQAISQPLKFKLEGEKILAPHFVFYVKDLLVEKYGQRQVEQGGLEVITTLDLDIQKEAELVLEQELAKVAKFNVRNGAVLITKPETGEILAMVGSKDYFDFENDGNVNVVLMPRQPGSAIKLINYAVALGRGFTPATILSDTPIEFRIPGQKPYIPKNYDDRFHGLVSLRTALGSSLNVPAVKVLASYGVGEMIALGQKLGITTWDDPSRFGLSLTLGGGEVKMIDLATAYSVFANLGRRVDLDPILQVSNQEGKILFKKEKVEGEQVLRPGIAFLINDILTDDEARAVAFGRHSLLAIPQAKVAVKTGTTNNLKDNWAIGYTPQFLIAVWVGNNDNQPMSRVASGITGATPIWRRLTDYLLKIYPSTDWNMPDDVLKIEICSWGGTLNCSACPSSRWEYFLKDSLPKKTCTASDFRPSPTPAKKGEIL